MDFAEYEHLQGITWYAVDPDGHVAGFDGGALPANAIQLLSEWDRIDESIHAMKESSAYKLWMYKQDYWKGTPPKRFCPESLRIISDTMWPFVERNLSELPRRGIYQYRAGPVFGVLPPTYKLVGSPTDPIVISALPPDVREVIAKNVLPVQFAKSNNIEIAREEVG